MIKLLEILKGVKETFEEFAKKLNTHTIIKKKHPCYKDNYYLFANRQCDNAIKEISQLYILFICTIVIVKFFTTR